MAALGRLMDTQQLTMISIVVIIIAVVITLINVTVIRKSNQIRKDTEKIVRRTEALNENPLLKPRSRELYDQHNAKNDYVKTSSDNTDESANSVDERGVNET